MKKITLLISAVSVLISINSHGWDNNLKVTMSGVDDNGIPLIILDNGGGPNPAKCTSAWYRIDPNPGTNVNRALAVALTAYATKKQVSVNVHPTECQAGTRRMMGIVIADPGQPGL